MVFEIVVLPAARLPRGTVIGRQYEIVGAIGHGANGLVYKGRDRSLNRMVAIKIGRPGDASSLKMLSEAKTLASVRHVNVVGVHAFGHHRGAPYLVMELMSGPTVQRWLGNRTQLPTALEVGNLLHATCRGVAALHHVGLAHGDLAAKNVFLDVNQRVAIGDFGLASRIGTQVRRPRGTATSMAPELLNASSKSPVVVSPHQDIYSIGVLVHLCLTGHAPYEGDSLDEVRAAQQRTSLDDVVNASPVLETFRSVLTSSLEPNIDRRATNALQLAKLFRTTHRRSLIPAAPTNRSVLVIDDDPDFLSLVETLIIGLMPNVSALTTTNIDEAIELIKSGAVHAVLTDLTMPDGGGVALVQRARALNALIPIAIVTASGSARDWQRLRALGADHFLCKPIDRRTLVDILNRMLNEEREGIAEEPSVDTFM